MYTIGQMVKRFGISRSALLYYDSIGLLKASSRNSANYRLYSEQDKITMQKIATYREAGLSLSTIKTLLKAKKQPLMAILDQRICAINQEINKLRDQQQVILDIIKNETHLRNTRIMSKDHWVHMLRAAGLTEEGMHKWHQEFEKSAPQAHQDFLESLGIKDAEIKQIRQWSSETMTATVKS